jgi:ATP-binding cassette, subfamily B, bacterial
VVLYGAPGTRVIRHPLRRGLALLRPAAPAAAVLFTLALLGALASLFEPLLLMRLFDALAEGGEGFPAVWRAGLLLAGLELLRQILFFFTNSLTWKTRLLVHHEILERTVAGLHRAAPGRPEADGVGAVLTRLDRGIQGFLAAFTEVLLGLTPAFLYLTVSAVLMFRLEPRLAVVSLLCAPVPGLIGLLAVPSQTRRERVLLDRWGRIYSRFREVLSGLLTVRSFVQEDREKDRFLSDVRQTNDVVARGVTVDSAVASLQGLTTGLARVGVLLYGGWLAYHGETTGGTIVAFLSYLGGLFGPVRGLSGLYGTLQRASVSVEALLEILDRPEGVRDHPTAATLLHVRGDVAFDGVKFAYPGSPALVLDGIDLRVRAGETIALVGPSGAGKSTLMSLLQRMYDPVEGSVTLDGADLRFLRQQSLRRNIGVVLQEPFLFNDTVRNNIAYGAPEKPFQAVVEAARAAQAEDFIGRLPRGYDTRIGEGGGRLSGGERQRLAIARALLKDPPVLILDEATSALDSDSETRVRLALEGLLKGRTTFVIAHRLSTVVNATRILVLKDGRVVEQGPHAELVRAGGYYASLVEKQVHGLLLDPSQDRPTP